MSEGEGGGGEVLQGRRKVEGEPKATATTLCYKRVILPCKVGTVVLCLAEMLKLNSLNYFYLESMNIGKEDMLMTSTSFFLFLLTRRAASLIVQKSPDLLNVVKDDGFAALHLASLNGHHNVVECLIKVQREFHCLTDDLIDMIDLVLQKHFPGSCCWKEFCFGGRQGLLHFVIRPQLLFYSYI